MQTIMLVEARRRSPNVIYLAAEFKEPAPVRSEAMPKPVALNLVHQHFDDRSDVAPLGFQLPDPLGQIPIGRDHLAKPDLGLAGATADVGQDH
jgi:hypothetical protein